MQIGNFQGQEPQRTHEEQAHFGLWTIVSSPLILGCECSLASQSAGKQQRLGSAGSRQLTSDVCVVNMSDQETMDRVFPMVTNADALSINEAW